MRELLNAIQILINLDIKESRKYSSKNKNICYTLFMFVGIIAISVFFGLIASLLLNLFGTESYIGMTSTIIFVTQVILFFYALTSINKKVFQAKDNELLICLPVSRKEIFIARMCEVYLNALMMSVLVYFPIMITFGICFGVNYLFYIFMVFSVTLVPMIPCGLAGIIALPMNEFINYLKFRFIIKLSLIVVVTITLFYIYNLAIFHIADSVLLKNVNSDNIIYSAVSLFKNKWFPTTWLSSVLFGEKIVLHILLFLLISILIFVVGILVNMYFYNDYFLKSIENKTSSKVINSNTKKRNPFISYCIFELKGLFRNSTYLFTYFGMALSMPIMVLFCNNFILEFAANRVGQAVNFGTTLFVVLIFTSIICSPSASFISKEGDNFWIFKTNPNGIRLPILAKSLVGVSLVTLSLLATFIIVVAFKFVSITLALLIVLIAIIYVIGLIFFGVLINLINPNLFKAGKENNFNVIIHMLVGFIISMVLGITSIIMTFSHSYLVITLIMLGIVTAFALINVVLLLTLHKKLYVNMEVR